jgi:surfeit locus 1 family protein
VQSLPPARRRRGRKRLIAALVLATGLFVALGVWQVERRSEKLALIAAVNERVNASPSAAPGPAEWPHISPARDAYRHVVVQGTFEHDRETQAQAVTDLGAGYWVLTPLRTKMGWTVLVNRGFVLPENRPRDSRLRDEPNGPVTVTGLLRISEPKGAFLRTNDPKSDRDVTAIGHARQLENLAPYFIDAGATPTPAGQPVGGLTVIAFYNHHLQYALTWLALAMLSIGGACRRLP